MKNKIKTFGGKNILKIFCAVFFATIFFGGDFARSSGMDDADFSKENKEYKIKQKLDQKILMEFDFGFNEGEKVEIDGREYTVVDTKGKGGAVGILQEYLQPVFLFFTGLIVVVAVIMIIVGGFEMMLKSTSGDIQNGKKRITQALIGIVLVFLSSLILHVVNPTFFTL